MDDSSRPSKRARRELSPPISTQISIPVPLPAAFTRAPPTTFQMPAPVTSFSYSPTRELLLNERQNEALVEFKEPVLGSDLNQGFEQCEWRDSSVDEGLDSLLLSLLEWSKKDETGAAEYLLGRIHILTWRGMISKVLSASYEVENEFESKRRADGWQMNGMVIDGVLYLEDANSPEKMKLKKKQEEEYLRQGYYGYSFESNCTRPIPSTSTLASEATPVPPSEEFSIPNTNVQWCSVVKTNLGGFRMILGGEVDCVAVGKGKEKEAAVEDFMELKTNIVIESERDEMMFERQKLLKHYIQSFLLGVPKIIVGFRTRAGILTAMQTFKTMEIPRLVRNKAHAWDPMICLASGKEILTFVHLNIGSHPTTQLFQSSFDDSIVSVGSATATPVELESWPIFRITFQPNSNDGQRNGQCSIRILEKDEVVSEVLGGKKVEERVGFLLKSWVDGVRGRRISAAATSTTQIRNG